MQNVFAIINLDSKTVVAEATHYQVAAEICNELDGRFLADKLRTGCVRLPHSVCRIDYLQFVGITR